MLRYTLDTNCIYALEEERWGADALRKLISAHGTESADVALVAISASDRQLDGCWYESFDTFQSRLARLGISHLPLLRPIGYWGITYWDWCAWAAPELLELEQRIHRVLFPNEPLRWEDRLAALGEYPVPELVDREYPKWRNRRCDDLALLSHVSNQRDVFVTSDGAFHQATKVTRLIDLGAGRIARPDALLALLNGVA